MIFVPARFGRIVSVWSTMNDAFVVFMRLRWSPRIGSLGFNGCWSRCERNRLGIFLVFIEQLTVCIDSISVFWLWTGHYIAVRFPAVPTQLKLRGSGGYGSGGSGVIVGHGRGTVDIRTKGLVPFSLLAKFSIGLVGKGEDYSTVVRGVLHGHLIGDSTRKDARVVSQGRCISTLAESSAIDHIILKLGEGPVKCFNAGGLKDSR